MQACSSDILSISLPPSWHSCLDVANGAVSDDDDDDDERQRTTDSLIASGLRQEAATSRRRRFVVRDLQVD